MNSVSVFCAALDIARPISKCIQELNPRRVLKFLSFD